MTKPGQWKTSPELWNKLRTGLTDFRSASKPIRHLGTENDADSGTEGRHDDPSFETWAGEDLGPTYITGKVKPAEECERTGGKKSDCDCSC